MKRKEGVEEIIEALQKLTKKADELHLVYEREANAARVASNDAAAATNDAAKAATHILDDKEKAIHTATIAREAESKARKYSKKEEKACAALEAANKEVNEFKKARRIEWNIQKKDIEL